MKMSNFIILWPVIIAASDEVVRLLLKKNKNKNKNKRTTRGAQAHQSNPLSAGRGAKHWQTQISMRLSRRLGRGVWAGPKGPC
jgi:hypothetical protein